MFGKSELSLVLCGFVRWGVRRDEQGSWGQHGAHMGPTGLCYLGSDQVQCSPSNIHTIVMYLVISDYLIVCCRYVWIICLWSSGSLQWRHHKRGSVSSHPPGDCLLKLLFRRRSKKTPKLRITGLCEGNSPVTGEFPLQRVSYVESVSTWQCNNLTRVYDLYQISTKDRKTHTLYIINTLLSHSRWYASKHWKLERLLIDETCSNW